MENSEYNKRTNPMVKFLMGVYGDNMNVVASIVTAQAQQNTKCLFYSLKQVSATIDRWIEELNEIDKKNESKKD